MSTCKRNLEILDSYCVSDADLTGFDHRHAESCSSCQEALNEAIALRATLRAYVTELDGRADSALIGTPPPVAARPLRVPVYAWIGLAAGLAVVFLVGLLHNSSAPIPPPEQAVYLEAIDREALHSELESYLQQSQLFLMDLMDGSISCARSAPPLSLLTEKKIAFALVYQKRLLEPRLMQAGLADLRPVLDEVELLCLEILNSEDCVSPEDLELWQRMVTSGDMIMRLNLLRMEDRI